MLLARLRARLEKIAIARAGEESTPERNAEENFADWPACEAQTYEL
jgi:hypothetical protein